MSNYPIKFLVIHAAATYPDMDIDIEWIRDIHVNQNKWSDVGYHYFIRRDGTVEEGRPPYIQGAHVGGGGNRNSLGICLAGGLQRGTDLPEDNFTLEQFQSLNKLLTDLIGRFGEDVQIVGHNFFTDKKACPCYDWQAHVQWLRKTWRSLYLPDDWWKRDWKEGINKDWNEVNWYKEVDVVHRGDDDG